MIYLNSAINPFLYNAMSRRFRAAVARTLSCDPRRSSSRKVFAPVLRRLNIALFIRLPEGSVYAQRMSPSSDGELPSSAVSRNNLFGERKLSAHRQISFPSMTAAPPQSAVFILSLRQFCGESDLITQTAVMIFCTNL